MGAVDPNRSLPNVTPRNPKVKDLPTNTDERVSSVSSDLKMGGNDETVQVKPSRRQKFKAKLQSMRSKIKAAAKHIIDKWMHRTRQADRPIEGTKLSHSSSAIEVNPEEAVKTKSAEYGRAEGVGISEAPLTDLQLDRVLAKIELSNENNEPLKRVIDFTSYFLELEDKFTKIPFDKTTDQTAANFKSEHKEVRGEWGVYGSNRQDMMNLLPDNIPENDKIQRVLNYIRAVAEKWPEKGPFDKFSIDDVRPLAEQYLGADFPEDKLESLAGCTQYLLGARNSIFRSEQRSFAKEALAHPIYSQSEQRSNEFSITTLLQGLPFIQKLLKRSLPKGTILSVSAHSDRNYTLKDAEKEGCIDYAYVDRKTGQAYVVDTTGHDKPDNKGRFDPIHEDIQSRLTKDSKNPIPVIQKLAGHVDGEGTFHYLRPVMTIEGLQLLSLAVGDGTTYIVNKDGQFEAIPLEQSKGKAGNLSSLAPLDVRMTKLPKGDCSVVNITDGITDFMSAETMSTIWLECGKDARMFTTACIQVMVAARDRKIHLGGIKEYDPDKPSNRDDCAVAVINLHNPNT